MLKLRKIGGIVFLHHAIAVGAAEIEDVMRVLFKKGEIVVHGLGKEFADDLGVFPAPLGIQVGIADDVQRRLIGQVRRDGLFSRGGSRGRRGVGDAGRAFVRLRLCERL